MKQRFARIAIGVMVLVPVLPTAAAHAAEPLPSVAACITSTNAHRQRAGLPALREHGTLRTVAVRHSQYQARANRMTHTGSGGSTAGTRLTAVGYRFQTWAENVAVGYRDCAAVMRGWMNSPGHKANILNRRVVHVGIGVARASNGRIYWTMVLAKSR